MRGLLLQHHVVAVREPHQLTPAEVRHQAGEQQREQQERAHHQPTRAIGLLAALETQALFGLDEAGKLRPHGVAQLLAAALPHRLLVIGAALAHGDQAAGVFIPVLLERGNAFEPLLLLPVVRNQLAERVDVALDPGQGGLVGLQKALVPGNEKTAQAGFHVDAAPLQLAGAARDAVGVLDRTNGRQQEDDQADEHQCADQAAQQRQFQVAAQQAVEIIGVDRGRSFHSGKICKQNFSSFAQVRGPLCRRRPRDALVR
jgi:hypothetical protein